MGKWNDFWFGKKVTEEFDIKKAVATITMEDGTVHTVSSVGRILDLGQFGVSVRTGENILKEYLEDSTNFIENDEGKMIPIHKINNVELKVSEYKMDYTYKK